MITLSPEKQTLLNLIVERLSGVPGVKAIVLGGSYARGTAREGSDMDVAMYYTPDAPFKIDDIRAVAAEISAEGTPNVTDFYGWGPWVNGGAWIHTRAGKVDFLYRSLEQVERAIEDAHQGITHHDFNQQPAFGFYSVIYLAETKICRPLYDPDGRIARLKTRVSTYPPLLKEKSVPSHLWLAEFTLMHADSYAASGDVYATVAAFTRTASYLTQALFALNEVFFMNDKTAVKEMAAFAHLPAGYTERLNAILACPGHTPADLTASVAALRQLWKEVSALR